LVPRKRDGCARRYRCEGNRLTVASLEQIGDWLQAFDSELERVTARSLEYRGGGGSGAWTCDCDDDNQYIVKAHNNQHEHDAPRLKIVTTELVCGRLGALFTPPVAPESRVVILPSALTSAVIYPGTSTQPAADGVRVATPTPVVT
jgi:hypothetical protein